MEVQKILREGIPAEILALTGGVFAGLGLASMRNILKQVPGIIVMVPAFLGMRGDIASSLASRMGTALHSGTIEPVYGLSDEVTQNVIGAFTLSILEATLIGVLAHFTTVILGAHASDLIALLGISLFATLISSGIMIPITVLSTIFFYKRNIDPDTVMSPYLATFGDVVSIFALFIATKVVMGGF